MDEELTQEQFDRKEQIEIERRNNGEELSDIIEPPTQAGAVTTTGMLRDHWLIFATAALFDVIALIPAISLVTNPIFGGILFLYLAPKKSSGDIVTQTLFRTLGFTVVDAVSSFVPLLDLAPLNIANAYRGIKNLNNSDIFSTISRAAK